MSRRYIDANKLIERLRHNPDFLTAPKHSKDGIIDEIVYQPTADVVEVVRCKDCIHYQKGGCNHFGYYTYTPDVDEDDFCSFGERREDNDNSRTN